MERGGVVRGKRVAVVRVERAKQLRREMTPAERVLWAELRGNRLGGLHFRRPQVIEGCFADFYCERARLVVEVDGAVHDQQVEYDQERDAFLKSRGLEVLRVRNERVGTTLNEVLQEILTKA